ncbi:hypothetical protein M407DRAFT_8498 [Tulasnella calospora MUT 4182]|uniref:Uncharacterized protein n=1 Tax=Tulasnella calospora MUT 4182 TaxID=1051891 RepID=A0A0C3LV65_9AGAM|nr:hypothetical protein M407DRAFT_8498 [Tulasnella calospora MUT 4182]
MYNLVPDKNGIGTADRVGRPLGAGRVPEGAEKEKVGSPEGAGREPDGRGGREWGTLDGGGGGGGREEPAGRLGAGREPESEGGAGAARAAATKVKTHCLQTWKLSAA